MGRKSDRRDQRIAAARARDTQLVDAGRADPMLLDYLRESRSADARGFAAAAALARREAARPSSPDHVRALIVLGGLEALERSAPTAASGGQ